MPTFEKTGSGITEPAGSRTMGRGGDAAGEDAFGDGDEVRHLVADVAVAIGVEPVRLDHQRTRPDQEVAEARPRADARMPVMGRV